MINEVLVWHFLQVGVRVYTLLLMPHDKGDIMQVCMLGTKVIKGFC